MIEGIVFAPCSAMMTEEKSPNKGIQMLTVRSTIVAPTPFPLFERYDGGGIIHKQVVDYLSGKPRQ